MVTNLLLPPKGKEALVLPSYVKLDGAFGLGASLTLFDKSRYRSHGTISGASWATGVHGYALDFVSATPSYVEIPASHTQLDFTSEDFSLIVRIYFDSLTGNPHIFNRGLGNVDGWRFYAIADGRLEATTYQSGAGQTTRSEIGSVTTATWYTLGISRSGTSIIIYKNGVGSNVVVGTHTNLATCARTAKIGVYDNKTAAPFDGKIEFLRIFGGIALSASEHLAWHNALA